MGPVSAGVDYDRRRLLATAGIGIAVAGAAGFVPWQASAQAGTSPWAIRL